MNRLSGVAPAGLVLSLFGVAASEASPSLEVEYKTAMGTYSGLDYVYVEGIMTGTVERDDGSTGSYEVPVVLVYPESGGNGVGIVDQANAPFFGVHVDSEGNVVKCERGTAFCEEGIREGRLIEQEIIANGMWVTDGYLFDEGFTYLAVQRDKTVTEHMGPEPPDGTDRRRLAYGTIERAFDSREIIRDAALWLRDPSDFTGNGAPEVAAQDYLIHYGFSQGAFLLRGWLADGFNEAPDDSLYFDGFLIAVAGAMVSDPFEDGPVYWTIPEPRPGHISGGDAKVIAIDTESDLEVFVGALARDPAADSEDADPNFVRWEVPGTAHLGLSMQSLTHLGATRQNPVEYQPVLRAGFYHLKNWVVEDEEPPPTTYIDGDFNEDQEWVAGRDDAGNALGGVRLPHLSRTVDDATIGAPVGTYGGTEWPALAENNIFVALGGTFERFSVDELTELYPSRDDYEERHTAALEAVLAEGYVLEWDRARYLSLAEGSVIPDPDDRPDQDAGVGGGAEDQGSGGCTVQSAPGASALTLMGGLFLFVVIRRSAHRRRTAKPQGCP